MNLAPTNVDRANARSLARALSLHGAEGVADVFDNLDDSEVLRVLIYFAGRILGRDGVQRDVTPDLEALLDERFGKPSPKEAAAARQAMARRALAERDDAEAGAA